MPFLETGSSATVVIPATQSIRVGALNDGSASIVIPATLPGGPVQTIANTQTVFGPFASGATVSVLAVRGVCEYVVGATPVLTAQQFNPASVAVTGGTINATSVGATTRSTGAFTSLAANLPSNVTLNAAVGTTLSNPILSSINTVNAFTQNAVQNKSAAANSSADFIAYPDNNSTDVSGFVDIGVTSSGFADPAYTITGQNDSYLFGSGVSGASKPSNLVICTDSTGTTNDIVFGTGGFLVANEKMRLKNTGQLNLKPIASAPSGGAPGDIYYDSTLGKLRVRTASGFETITSA